MAWRLLLIEIDSTTPRRSCDAYEKRRETVAARARGALHGQCAYRPVVPGGHAGTRRAQRHARRVAREGHRRVPARNRAMMGAVLYDARDVRYERRSDPELPED